MGHEITGFAGRLDVLSRLRGRWPGCRLYHLTPRKEFAFLPLAVAEEEGDGEGRSVPDEFLFADDFGPAHILMLAGYSKDAALAWVRTDYFGSRGSQTAILWASGAHVFGPDEMWTDDDAKRPSTEWPINRALCGIGIAREEQSDEFLMFGLGGYRSYEDIVAGATVIPP